MPSTSKGLVSPTGRRKKRRHEADDHDEPTSESSPPKRVKKKKTTRRSEKDESRETKKVKSKIKKNKELKPAKQVEKKNLSPQLHESNTKRLQNVVETTVHENIHHHSKAKHSVSELRNKANANDSVVPAASSSSSSDEQEKKQKEIENAERKKAEEEAEKKLREFVDNLPIQHRQRRGGRTRKRKKRRHGASFSETNDRSDIFENHHRPTSALSNRIRDTRQPNASQIRSPYGYSCPYADGENQSMDDVQADTRNESESPTRDTEGEAIGSQNGLVS